ncbi:MAG: hypothetical protein ABEJ72_08730, partial [Candidatus Aenigmatarchaeota archaeon]
GGTMAPVTSPSDRTPSIADARATIEEYIPEIHTDWHKGHHYSKAVIHPENGILYQEILE